MKKTFTKILTALALLVFMMPSLVGWGQTRTETTTTYTFSTKSWAASPANWTSGKDGNSYQNNQGVQVTTGSTGANATSPISFSDISKVEVRYCTNASSGVGTIKIQVGSGTEQSFSVTKPSSGGTTLKTATFNYSTYETGNVKITVNCSTNSVYIHSVAITTSSSGSSVSAPEISPASCTFTTTQAVTITPASGTTVYYTTDGTEPSNSGTGYTTAKTITLTSTTTVRAIAYDNEDNTLYSDLVEETYTKLTTIANITAAGTYAVKGTVVAKSSYGMVLGDGTGYIYFSNGNASPSNNIGDVIMISGSVTATGPSGSYAKLLQFTNTTSTITEATGSGYDGTPAVTTITDALPYYSEGSHLSDYYQFAGT